MKEDLVTIIVPVYNVEKFLTRCVDSITHQTYQNLEILLINDGSTDSSLQVCEELKKSDDRIVVFDKKNEGLSSTRNFGIKRATGKWLSFIDSDDYIEPNMIATLLSVNKTNNTKIACGGRYDVYEDTKNKIKGLCPLKDEVIEAKEGIRRILNWQNLDSSACDKLFSADLWNDISFPVGRIVEDVAVMYRVFDEADRISMVAKPFYCYFHRSNSITTSSYSDKSLIVIDNVKVIGAFVSEKYPELADDLLYFKCHEYCWLLSIMAKSKKRNKQIEKDLIVGVRKSSTIFNRMRGKEKIRAILFSHRFTYFIFRCLSSK